MDDVKFLFGEFCGLIFFLELLFLCGLIFSACVRFSGWAYEYGL